MNSSTEGNRFGSSPEPIVVGYIRRAHGIRGAVVIRPMSDDPERFAVGNEFLTDEPSEGRVKLVAVQAHRDGLLATFEGVADRTAADALRGVSLLIEPSERRVLSGDEYWPEDLIGLAVHDPAGRQMGTVVDVVEGPSQDRLRVASQRGEFDIPFVADLVTQVDVAGNRLVVDLPEGLEELEEPGDLGH